MFGKKIMTLLLCCVIGLAFGVQPAAAQFGKLKDKVKKKVENKVDKKTDDAIDDALDGAEDAVEGDGKQAQTSDQKQKTQTTASGGSAKSMRPGEGAWQSYDFVPGDRVIYYEDFADSPIGDFPRRIEFVEGNMEVAEWEGSRYLFVNGSATFEIPLPENLPEDFTIEIEAYLPKNFVIYFHEGSSAPHKSINDMYRVEFRTDHQLDLEGGLMRGGKTLSGGAIGRDLGFFDARLMVSGSYAKVYANEMRVANVPNSEIARVDKLLVELKRGDYRSTDPALIGEIRIAEGGKRILYDELEASGRVATQGIYFDSGSDRLRPESTPTLKEIGRMLQDHGDLRVRIEGHTDSVGEDADNLDLSGRRAAAVKSFLVETYGVDDSRLETEGFGETKPVDDNTTSEGRQNNRRVELVKLS